MRKEKRLLGIARRKAKREKRRRRDMLVEDR
jgi:hypothetical protein